MILYGIFEHLEYTFSELCPFIAKYSIYNSCLHEEKLCFDSFLALLKEKINIQREIAIANNKITIFNETYGMIL